jgi:hypothetical protein
VRHQHTISRLRDGTPGRDKAILDLLHLRELGLVPGRAPVRLLENLWCVRQSQVSRRMAAVAELGVVYVKACYGTYLLVETSDNRRAKQPEPPAPPDDETTWAERRERYESARRRLQPAYGVGHD